MLAILVIVTPIRLVISRRETIDFVMRFLTTVEKESAYVRRCTNEHEYAVAIHYLYNDSIKFMTGDRRKVDAGHLGNSSLFVCMPANCLGEERTGCHSSL